ncbi:hypothetical protein [Dictyobacter arantiisoli]|uniref:hypothetical protein n=1 Tax=Dictyobacter arantiisoli TaxID=2014874 RepID=UPI00155B176A|nr:hypothetical protein [Dictyobacter arantiisoli]
MTSSPKTISRWQDEVEKEQQEREPEHDRGAQHVVQSFENRIADSCFFFLFTHFRSE